jgi:SAM-dependent methyltransferase
VQGPVLDLCCGIGGDLVALARAGVDVLGIDLDPLTVAVANANLSALSLTEGLSGLAPAEGLSGPGRSGPGRSGRATAQLGDAVGWDPSPYAAVFADPGRRSAERGRIFDPRAYEPPLDVLLEIAGRSGCVKVAPGIPHEAIPDGAEAEWVSDGGEVKEAALWLGGLAGSVRRRATLLPSGASLVPEAGLGEPGVGGWRRFLYEPDGAVIRARLVAEVAALVDGVLVDPHIAYITADRHVATPFARAYEIADVLPFSVKRLRAEVRRRRAGHLTIKKRGSAVDVERLRRDLRPGGPEALTVVLTRVGTAPFAVLCHPVCQ